MKKIVLVILAVGVMMMVGCKKTEEGDKPSGNDVTPADTVSPGGGQDDPVEWIDLGLPSGLLWAKCNIGTTLPEGYGDCFAWGETETKNSYSSSTYHWSTESTITKYNTSEEYGTVDNLTTLEAEDDVATVVLGGSARMPTYDDWVELRSNTDGGVWTELNGINGWKFTAANGQSLFLPAAGSIGIGSRELAGRYGYYWSSSLHIDNPSRARYFYFYSGGSDLSNCYRFCGYPVRAVRGGQN